MAALNKCTIRSQCILDLIPEIKEEWPPFLYIGQNLCQKREWTKAEQSLDQALQFAEDLPKDEGQLASRIKGWVFLCTATMSSCQEHDPRATEYFYRAQQAFLDAKEDYGVALTYFALGKLYEAKKEWRDVFRFYERAQRRLKAPPGSIADKLKQEVSERRAAALIEWQKSIGDDPTIPVNAGAPSSEEIKANPNFGNDSSNASEELSASPPSKFSTKGISLEFLPIFSEIAAGSPHPIPEQATEYIESDQFIISGKRYFLNNGKSSLRLVYSSDTSYVAVRVHGDSMDNAGINNGDCVILRTRIMGLPLQPQNGDIVAVALPPEEQEVTLKRFKKSEKRIIFEPESSNPKHEPYTYDTIGEFDFPIRVRIVGILVAVLKPL